MLKQTIEDTGLVVGDIEIHSNYEGMKAKELN